MKVLFLGSHCDDIELGCAATINKHRNDWTIRCAVLSRYGRNEAGLGRADHIVTASLEKLGVDEIYFENFPVDHFHQMRQNVYLWLRTLKSVFKPDLVVTQIADEHQDHVVLNEESIRVFRQGNLLAYLSSFRSERHFRPDTYEQVGAADVEAKVSCLNMYREFYPTKNYLDEANVRAMMRVNGIYPGVEFAEVYQTITRIGLSQASTKTCA